MNFTFSEMNKDKIWYKVSNVNEIPTPALLVYPERIEENSRRMIVLAGGADRLRPHVKTHKMPEIVRLQSNLGIKKFKCATIAEAEMAACSGADDVLLAMQPVGPAIDRFINLVVREVTTRFSCIVDSEKIILQIAEKVKSYDGLIQTELWLDINVGMNRTGIAPGADALHLFKLIASMPELVFRGLHVYDGHIHDGDPEIRKKKCSEGFLPVWKMADEIVAAGLPYPEIVAGGTPSFPVHAAEKRVSLSPGTTTLWDERSASSYPDLDFLYAALILTRVVSKPAPGLLCLDCGTKSMACEMPHPRIKILGIESYQVNSQNEEHLVIETKEAGRFEPGDCLYGIPTHICPTVEHYDEAYAISNGRFSHRWRVEARGRRISI
jgi:D-serine deaminase-like pyridoxal phosphate-dependent protein